MSKTLTKYKVVKELGTIFASDVTTEYVPLTNDKNVEFIVATGVGTSAKTKFQILAKLNSDGSEISIPYKENNFNTNTVQMQKDDLSLPKIPFPNEVL